MSAPPENIDKLEQIRKRSEKKKQDKAYAARLAMLEEQRAAKTKSSGGTLLIIVLIFIALAVGVSYLLLAPPEKEKVSLLLSDVTKLSVVERVKQNPAVMDLKIFQKESKPKELKLVIYVDLFSTIRDGERIGNEVMGELIATNSEQGVGSVQYDYIIVISYPNDRQLILGRVDNGARSITWK